MSFPSNLKTVTRYDHRFCVSADNSLDISHELAGVTLYEMAQSKINGSHVSIAGIANQIGDALALCRDALDSQSYICFQHFVKEEIRFEKRLRVIDITDMETIDFANCPVLVPEWKMTLASI